MEDHIQQEEEQAGASEHIERLFDALKQYGQTHIDIVRLKAADKFSDIIAAAIATTVVAICLLLCFVLLSIGIALLLGALLGKTYYGFFALAGFYCIVGLIFYAMRKKWISDPVGNIIIRKLFK